MSPSDADEMANSVDSDQTAPLGAVWSGSALFAQAYLSVNVGSLRYCVPSGTIYSSTHNVEHTLVQDVHVGLRSLLF